MNAENKKIVTTFKALCDENRIQIIKLLGQGEKCGFEILKKMDITQPTLSHHMKILCDSGVVTGRKSGKWVHYSLSKKGIEYAHKSLKNILPEDM